MYAVNTERFLGDDDGSVRALALVEVELVGRRASSRSRAPSASSRPSWCSSPWASSARERTGLLDQLGVELDARGNVARDAAYRPASTACSSPATMGRGQSLIVWAIAEGRSAAAGVDRWLSGSTTPAGADPAHRAPARRLERRRTLSTCRTRRSPCPPSRPLQTLSDKVTLCAEQRSSAPSVPPPTRPSGSAPRRSRHGRRPAQPQPRRPTPSTRSATSGSARRPTRPAAASAILADLQGPKIRLGTLRRRPRTPRRGDEFTITIDDVPGDATICVAPPTRASPATSTPATRILVDDGKVALEVTEVDGPHVRTARRRRRHGLRPQGPQPPRRRRQRPRAVREGRRRPALGAAHRRRHHRPLLRPPRRRHRRRPRIMDEEGVRLPVIAKIEKPQAVENLETIVAAFDGIMVARGDLGVEMPARAGPARPEARHQARQAQRQAGHRRHPDARLDDRRTPARPAPRPPTSPTPSSTAPTRVMLSGETTRRRVPRRDRAHHGPHHRGGRGGRARQLPADRRPQRPAPAAPSPAPPPRWATSSAPRSLVAFTQSGDTARLLARYRSPIPLLAFTPDARGPQPARASPGASRPSWCRRVDSTDEMVDQVDAALLRDRPLPEGRPRRDHRRLAPRRPRLHQPHPHPPRRHLGRQRYLARAGPRYGGPLRRQRAEVDPLECQHM